MKTHGASLTVVEYCISAPMGPLLFVPRIQRVLILPEEHALRRRFGEEHDGYCRRVNRGLGRGSGRSTDEIDRKARVTDLRLNDRSILEAQARRTRRENVGQRLQAFAEVAAYAGAPTASAGLPKMYRSSSDHGAAMRSPVIAPGRTP